MTLLFFVLFYLGIYAGYKIRRRSELLGYFGPVIYFWILMILMT
jgi:hypothetical protein